MKGWELSVRKVQIFENYFKTELLIILNFVCTFVITSVRATTEWTLMFMPFTEIEKCDIGTLPYPDVTYIK